MLNLVRKVVCLSPITTSNLTQPKSTGNSMEPSSLTNAHFIAIQCIYIDQNYLTDRRWIIATCWFLHWRYRLNTFFTITDSHSVATWVINLVPICQCLRGEYCDEFSVNRAIPLKSFIVAKRYFAMNHHVWPGKRITVIAKEQCKPLQLGKCQRHLNGSRSRIANEKEHFRWFVPVARTMATTDDDFKCQTANIFGKYNQDVSINQKMSAFAFPSSQRHRFQFFFFSFLLCSAVCLFGGSIWQMAN